MRLFGVAIAFFVTQFGCLTASLEALPPNGTVLNATGTKQIEAFVKTAAVYFKSKVQGGIDIIN